MTSKPPIRCTPCRVKYNGEYYRIKSDGSVHYLLVTKNKEGKIEFAESEIKELDHVAKTIRREAARLRRNRNSRERRQAMKDLGLKQTPYGWE